MPTIITYIAEVISVDNVTTKRFESKKVRDEWVAKAEEKFLWDIQRNLLVINAREEVEQVHFAPVQ